jgi:AcrR family transcriptional regulator
MPRSGPVRSEASRQSILRATADLLAERGYDHLSMEGIAARAGVGKQTIYRWWPSRSAIVAECLLEGMLMPGRLDLPDTGDIRADLTAWLDTLAQLLATEQGQVLMRSVIAAATDNPEIGRRLRDSLSGAQSVAGRLRAAVGTVPHLTPAAPVDAIAETLVGAIILRALARDAIHPDDRDRLLDAVLGPR